METMVYDVARDRLVRAATTEAQDPKTLQALVADLVKGAVSEMRKERFVN